MSQPSVSVVIPAYNAQFTIVRALQSVADQTFQVTEVIVIDDASTDNTVETVSEYSKNSTIAIRLLPSDRNVGPGSARNRGWDSSNSDYIAFLDADDVWHPRKIEIQVREMEKSSSFSMSCHERIVSVSHSFPKIDSSIALMRELSLNNFIIKNRCSTPTVMVRRTVSERYKNKKRYAEDYLLWMEIIAKHGNALFIQLPLTSCTNPIYGGAGLSGSFTAMQKGELDAFRTLRQRGHLSLVKFLMATMWSSIKFVVRIADHYIFRGLRQTVSESK
jgi:glycosyltransferase involved in cell wall biosynthesis